MPKGIDDEENNWGIKGMVSGKEVATTGISGKLPEVQCVCGECGEAVSTTNINVVELAREGIKVKRKNATMFSPQTDMEAQLVESRSVGRTIWGLNMAAEDRMKARKTQLADARSVLEKYADVASKTKADFCAKMAAAEKSFDTKRARVDRLQRELATELGKRQQSLAKRQETTQTVKRPLAEGEDSLLDLQ